MKKTKNHIIPALVVVVNVWTLLNVLFRTYDLYSLISILIGFAGVVLYYSSNKNFDKFFYLWVYMQVPDITYSGLNIMNSFPLSFGLGLGLTLKNDQNLSLYFNALPIGIYYLIKYFNVDKPIDASITINRLRKGTFPQIQFPINGIIEKLSGRNKMTGVYLITLEKDIQIKDKSYKYILLEPKSATLIDIVEKWQVCGLRICEDPNLPYSETQNPFIDWVTIQVKL